MTQARLIICPKSISNTPNEVAAITQTLTEIGLIGEVVRSNTYYAGHHFINLITFLGCSPNIQLSPDDGDNYCIIKISDISERSQLLGYCQSASPKCPNCKAKIKNWRHTTEHSLSSNLCLCKQCGTNSSLSDLKWRQEGGYGRFSISLSNIHPHEAVPAEKIFKTLEDTTDFEWTYFYANNETF